MIRKLLTILILSATCTAQAAELDSIRPLQRVTGAAAGLVVNAGVTELLKHTIHELRPDGSDNHSFPSRHSSWAFALSSTMSMQLGDLSPWWSVGGYAVASAVGYQRVYAHRHYTSDVLAGAAIGVASAEIGNLIARAIFKHHYRWGAEQDFRPTFGVTSGAIWPLQKLGNQNLYAMFTTGLRGSVPIAERWGLSTQVEGAICWSHFGRRMNVIMADAGVFYILPISRSLAFMPEIALGYGRLTDSFPEANSNRLIAKASVALDYRLTTRWSTTLRTGYTSGPVSAIFATISSTVNF